MSSVQKQLEDKLLQLIRGMQLDWPRSEEIRARRLPWDVKGDGTVVVHRGLTLYPLRRQYAAGTNEREDVGYGVGIALIVPADSSSGDNRDRVPAVQEAIRRKIVEDRFSPTLEGGTYIQTKVAETDVNIPKEAHRYEASGLAVRCWMREPRT